MDFKFTGDFKKLIPMGFKFHKLFARNYKVYEKNDIWIWVAHGGYVEIRDLYGHSGHAAKLIYDNKYPVYEKDIDYGPLLKISKGAPKSCLMDKKTGKVVSRRDFDKAFIKTDICRREARLEYRELLLGRHIFETLFEIKDMVTINGKRH